MHVACDPELTDEFYQELMEQNNAEFVCSLCDPNKRQAFLKEHQHSNKHAAVCTFQKHPIIAPPLIELVAPNRSESAEQDFIQQDQVK